MVELQVQRPVRPSDLARADSRVRAQPDRSLDRAVGIWIGQADRASALEVAGHRKF